MMEYRDRLLIAQLFRGRPYTKAIPFAKAFTGVADESVILWEPGNAYFELAGGVIRATVTADMYLADTDIQIPFAYIQPLTTAYTRIELGSWTFRSQKAFGSRLLLVCPAGVVATMKGVLYGWEVTKEGNYR